jgi:hypothetical protein
MALRFAPVDFRARSTDGTGDDWPINYDDIALYYDKVESYIGVFGSREGIATSPDGVFLPPPKPRCTEKLLKSACDKLDIRCIPARMAILTKPLNGRPACHYCGQCSRGCTSASNFSSSQVLLPPAKATGRLTLLTNAMAREIVLDELGRAKSVSYIDRISRTEQRVHARAFVIAASTCESARLLLNSRSSSFPNGLANSSGMVGRNLMESLGSFGLGSFQQLEKMPPHNHDGSGGNFLPHVYIPWWKFDRKNDFLRGYHIEPGGGRFMPVVGDFDDICGNIEGYGISLKESCKRSYGTTIGLESLGEMIPNKDTYCEIDPDAVDEWGIPTLRFHWRSGENEIKMARDMQQTFRAIVEAAGGTYTTETSTDGSNPYGIYDGGVAIHESGTVRMGADPKSSVLNGFLPNARREEPVRHRCRRVCDQPRQKSHTHHPGALLARFGVLAGSGPQGKPRLRRRARAPINVQTRCDQISRRRSGRRLYDPRRVRAGRRARPCPPIRGKSIRFGPRLPAKIFLRSSVQDAPSTV